jgi:hypothetical protein
MTWWMWLIGIAHTAVYVWAFWRMQEPAITTKHKENQK